MSTLAIHSNRTVMPHGVFEATTVIADGVIAMLIDGSGEGLEGEVLDVGDAVLMPGVIDPHVHINEPGRTDWEGFDTATRAAAAGGITTMIEMPLNSTPVTTSAEALNEKIKAADGQLHVNCGFWGGIIPDNSHNMEAFLQSGIFGIKAFLIDSGLSDFPNVKEPDLHKAMPAIAESKMPLLVHSELASHIDAAPIEDYSSFLASRPKVWEDDAIAMMIRLCAEYHCRTHIVHLSSSNSLQPIKVAKKAGLPITVETCPHYLMFNAESIPGDNTLYKCTPPIREKDNNDLLWKALSEGEFDFIASDHSPAPSNLKHLDDGNFEAAWGGIAGLQFLLSAFWTGASSRNMDLTDIARLLCQAPAEFIGLDSKGKIAVGYDADIVIWDPDKNVDTSPKCIQHKHKATPYSDLPMRGSVLQTYVNGQLVYEDGEFLSLGQGKALLKNQK